ncbi:MAG: hypothetical protein JW966_01805 [Anaerolineae bacterium]|nr:hypothetical protein [Anaerolineae bacterium]
MIGNKRTARPVGWMEGFALVVIGVVVALVLTGNLDGIALIILLVLGYFIYMARGVLIEAQRVRPVEPPDTWLITMIANLVLIAVGIGSFGWYLVGGGSRAWVPFLVFIAGVMALRMWRRNVVARLYAWRIPALKLLQQGEYKRLVRELEREATEGRGHPDKLAMVALAYVEQNKWDYADRLLARALQVAPDYASVNGTLGALRRHQARYAEAVEALQKALAFDYSAANHFYLGFCQYLSGDAGSAQGTLLDVIDHTTLSRQGQLIGTYLLGQIAEADGDSSAARQWYTRMAEIAPKTIPLLQDESRRHKQTPYGDMLKEHIRAMERIITRRPMEQAPAEHEAPADQEGSAV